MTDDGSLSRDREATITAGLSRLQQWLLDWIGLGDDVRRDVGRTLIRGSAGSFVLNVSLRALNFVIGVLLARLLGASGYGAYAYALGWVSLLSIPAGMGLSRLMIREVASYREAGRHGHLAGLLRWAVRTIGVSTVVTVGVAYGGLWLFGSELEPRIRSALQLGILLVPILVLVRTNQASLQGFHQVVRGQVPESLVQPIVFILAIVAAWAISDRLTTATFAVVLHILAAAAALGVSIVLLRRAVPDDVREATPITERSVWLRSALSLVLLGGLHVLNNRTDIIMLGAIAGAEPVGIYNVAAKGAELISFVAVPVHAALGPAVSTLYAGEEDARLQHVVSRSTQVVFWLSVPVALVLILFGRWFLVLFGSEFVAGQWPLAVLSSSQLFYLALGPVSLLLIMTNHERDAAMAVGIGAVLNVLLNAVLIPLYGAEGAAVATGASKLSWGAAMLFFVVRRLGLRPTLAAPLRAGGAQTR